MNNAVRQGADGEGSFYIEISDGEDSDDDIIAAAGLSAVGRQIPALQHINAQTPSPPPDPNGNDAPHPQGHAAPSSPREADPALQADADMAAFVIEDGDEFDVNDPYLAQIMMEAFNREHDEQAARQFELANQLLPDQQIEEAPAPVVETKIQCIDQVLAVFTGICRDHVSKLYDTIAQSSDFLIAHILDQIDKGKQYPKAKDTQKSLKRKRVDEDEEAVRKYGAADRKIPEGAGIRPLIRVLLSKDFPETPMSFIDSALKQSGYRLFSTYRVLEEAHRTFDPRNPPYNKIKYQRQMDDDFKDANLETTIQRYKQNPYQFQEAETLIELQAARRIKKKAEAKREAERQAEIEEEKNIQKAEAEGTMSECGCCFCDYPLNRMVHCDNDEVLHWFCRGCAKQNAETEIGNSKYQLICMSMDGCSAGFSLDQRKQFLDETTTIALERNEQEAVLRMAGIENLASCPFCPYAAEYPPIEIDREFRCQAEDCEKISCRLCKLESHIPKSCEEHAKDNGLSIRRQIEEAMSAALIRKCNKCGTPFVKEEGCNKMTCTRNGCFNVQCYICSKSCNYDHFDDTRRGGKAGNCPLFENVEDRHDSEVRRAEKEALDKVRAEHPEYTEEDLKVKMSENVKKDDERRKANDPRNRNLAAGVGLPARLAHLGGPAAMIYGFGAPAPFPGGQVIPVMPPVLPNYPQAPVQRPEYMQDIFADVNFNGNFDDEVFAGLWDNLPGLGLEQPAMGQPPPAPRLGSVRPAFVELPHRIPQPAPNQPAQPGAQPLYAVNQLPVVPAAPGPPPVWQWNNGPFGAGNAVGGGQAPREANAGNPPQAAAPANGNQPIDPQERILQLRGNRVNARQRANPQPQQGNLGAHAHAHQLQQGLLQVQQDQARERQLGLQRQAEQLHTNQNQGLQNPRKVRRQPGQPPPVRRPARLFNPPSGLN